MHQKINGKKNIEKSISFLLVYKVRKIVMQ